MHQSQRTHMPSVVLVAFIFPTCVCRSLVLGSVVPRFVQIRRCSMQASVIRMRFVPPSFQEAASILVGVKVVQAPPSSGLNDALALLRHKPVPASFICTSFHLQGLEKFNLQELSIRCMDILHGTVRPRELALLPTVSSHCIGNSHQPSRDPQDDNPLPLHSSACHSAIRHVLRLYASEMSALARSDTHTFRILLLPPSGDGARLTTCSARDENNVRKSENEV